MNTPLIAVLLLAAAPPAQKAKELAAHKEWEELYLAFAAADPAAYPEPQRPQVAGPLLKGCEALLADDAVMAYSLGAPWPSRRRRAACGAWRAPR